MEANFSFSRFVNLLFYFYNILIIVRIFLTWLPNIDWEAQPFDGMRRLTDPFLNIFRGIIPPIGGALDISPIVALIVLQLAQGFIVNFLFRIGL